ncbi:MAG TPA: hypothetical protein EYH27_00400 [Anaerolineales bacterium]|nr:hypothetical protein [Anaerolineae bacterium]HIP86881.1 hypothetical protein [Anaerolineales bacterium]
MLEQLLDLVRTGGSHRIPDLAEALGTTPEMVESMLEGLERMGYLKRLGKGCADRCAACPLARACAAGGGGRVWALAEPET